MTRNGAKGGGEGEDGEEGGGQSSEPDCAAAKLQGGGRAAPRGMCGAEEVTSCDHARHANFILQDADLMPLIERAAYSFALQYTVGGPPTPGSAAVRQPSFRAVAALRSPARKWSFGMGFAATASQQPGDPPSGGMQRAFHGCLVAHDYNCNGGSVCDELQVSIHMRDAQACSLSSPGCNPVVRKSLLPSARRRAQALTPIYPGEAEIWQGPEDLGVRAHQGQ